jgi:predicted esterase
MFIFLLALVLPLGARAQAIEPGKTVERIVTRSDSGLAYALYVPSSYSPGGKFPVMFLMDPRGRALVPLELFRDAAERHGWLLLSSYNTLSDADTAAEVNEKALNAMLLEAQQKLSLDSRRFYIGGFSGTARNAWAYAEPLDGHLAGIVGVGGGYSAPPTVWAAAIRQVRPFAYFGIAGDTDYNYDEMRQVHAALDGTPFPHRFARFTGPHSWPPKALATESLEWMQLQAMKSGLAPRDEAWIDSLAAARRARARALEAAGALGDALEEHRAIVADLAGVRDVAADERRVAEMGRDSRVTRMVRRSAELSARAQKYKYEVFSFSAAFDQSPIMPHARAVSFLQIPRVLREAADSSDREAQVTARRMVESAFSYTAFFMPREYLRMKDWAHALGVLRVANEFKPGHPSVCYSIARAQAQLGDRAAALDALSCAVEAGIVAPATLERDPLLEPLRAEPRFAELRERAATRMAAPR